MMVKSTRRLIAVGASLLTIVAAQTVHAQIVPAQNAIRLLLPESQLNSTEEGRALLEANLATVIEINNNATPQQLAFAVPDAGFAFDGTFTSAGLGLSLESALLAALAANDPALLPTGAFGKALGDFLLVPLTNASFAKNFYANGRTSESVGPPNFPGVALPADGIFDVYGVAYNTPPSPLPLNPYGSPRPLLTTDQIEDFGDPNVAAQQTGRILSTASFPSGGGTFGTAESLIMGIMIPERYQQLLARGSEIGLNRIIMGAHYPLDVIGGRIIALHDVVQMLNGNPDYQSVPVVNPITRQFDLTSSNSVSTFAQGTIALRQVLEAGCGASIAVCAAAGGDTRFANYEQNRADYLYRLTYGLPSVGPTDLAPVVPVGAEVLLSTRFPYLSAQQRRDVLATTELPSGVPLDDGSGWARLNMFAATDGYGAFPGDVTVTMDAALGGFHAFDMWRNDIGGAGSLTKAGTGSLVLTGDNSWAGSTTISGGMLALAGNGRLPATTQVSNAAVLSFVDGSPTAAQTIASYDGAAGSVIALDASLGGGSLAADRLVISGAVTPGTSTTILLNDTAANLPSSFDPAGIVLIKAASVPDGSFSLVGGSFDKGLVSYEISQSSSGDIVLYSTASPQADALAAVPGLLDQLVQGRSDLWQGELARVREFRGQALWGRVSAGRIESDDAGANYIAKPVSFTIGYDATSGSAAAGEDALQLNLLVSYLEETPQRFETVPLYASYRGGSFGAGLSYLQATGLFGYAQFHGDFVRVDIDSLALGAGGGMNTFTYGGRVGGGYRAKLANQMFVEPFADMVLLSTSGHSDYSSGELSISQDARLSGVAGFRIGKQAEESANGLSFTATGHARRRLSGDPGITIDTPGGAPFSLESQSTRTLWHGGITMEYDFGHLRFGITAATDRGSDFKDDTISVGLGGIF